jgi:hypothetical protein
MAFIFGGWFFAIAGLIWLAVKLYVSFDTEGGSLGMVPILDGAVIAPSFCWFGLWMLERVGCWSGLPLWGYGGAWVVSVVVAGCLLELSGKVGARYHRR